MISFFKSLLKYGILIFIFSPICFATWYQGSAKQSINALNFDGIRTQTIKHAIANAAIKSNSFIQVEDIVLDGLLQSSKVVLRSEGQIRRAEIISESVNDDVFEVIVNVDIKPLMSCRKDPYAKSLLLTQFPIVKLSQAAQGALFDLGAQTSLRFEQQLKEQPNIYVSSLLSKAFMLDDPAKLERYLEDVGRYLSLEYDSQFILFGAIRDISLFEQVKEQLLIDDVRLRRNFTLQLYLYDAIRGNILLQKNYHGEADWLYEHNHIVDTNNSVFWRTNYGRSILHTVSSAVVDINDILSCQQSLPQIIHSDSEQLVINIGENQGVKVGDKFELTNLRLLPRRNGRTSTLISVDPLREFSVIQVNHQSAVLTSDSNNIIVDNQLFNLVSPKSIF